MGQLTHGNSWTGSNTQTAKSKTYTFDTAGKYVDKNISFEVTAQDGAVGGVGSVTGTNISLSGSNTSGIAVVGKGQGKVTTSGWIEKNTTSSVSSQTLYATGVTLPNSKTFQINDGVYTWTWSKDANGNVTIV